MGFDDDVLKIMKMRKWRKKMNLSINLWFWSLREFCFFILVSLTCDSSIWNDTSSSLSTSHVATSSSVCHRDVFVTNDDVKDQNQNIYNLPGLFHYKKRYRDENQKHANLQRRFTYLSLKFFTLISSLWESNGWIESKIFMYF
jgi:hypothetical protein